MTNEPKKTSKSSPKTSAGVTSHDVARAAGVSQSAVSRAFSPDGKIAPATRARVLSAAKTLGYHPNAFARSLVQQRTRIVGVLVARLDNHFYPRVLEELTAGLWAAGRQVMYFNVDDSSDGGDGGGDLEGVLRTALQYRVEAMVLTSITLSSHLAETFYEAGVPVVLFNRRLDDPNVHAVACDNGTTLPSVGHFEPRYRRTAEPLMSTAPFVCVSCSNREPGILICRRCASGFAQM